MGKSCLNHAPQPAQVTPAQIVSVQIMLIPFQEVKQIRNRLFALTGAMTPLATAIAILFHYSPKPVNNSNTIPNEITPSKNEYSTGLDPTAQKHARSYPHVFFAEHGIARIRVDDDSIHQGTTNATRLYVDGLLGIARQKCLLIGRDEVHGQATFFIRLLTADSAEREEFLMGARPTNFTPTPAY